MDQKGYVISGLSFLLIIPAIYLIALFADISDIGSHSHELDIQSDITASAKRDIENNLYIITQESVQQTAKEVTTSSYPLHNSRTAIKRDLQKRMDLFTDKYNNEGINAECMIRSVDSSNDPFKVQVNSTISIKKGVISHKESLSHDISIIDQNYQIPDPLPFIKCKNFGGAKNINNRIFYGVSLSKFLKSSKKLKDVYINATSPLIIRRCPYSPYKTH